MFLFCELSQEYTIKFIMIKVAFFKLSDVAEDFL